jgi:hypothetical protein
VPWKDFHSLLFQVQNLKKKRNSIGNEREKEDDTARKGVKLKKKSGGGKGRIRLSQTLNYIGQRERKAAKVSFLWRLHFHSFSLFTPFILWGRLVVE